MSNGSAKLPPLASTAVLKHSDPVPSGSVRVSGIDFDLAENKNVRVSTLVRSMKTMGFQATSVGTACEIIDEMRRWRGKTKEERESEKVAKAAASGTPVDGGEEEEEGYEADYTDASGSARCTIFLGYTSNLISSGLRSTLRYLVKHKYVSAIVTTAGGVEEDIIKCLAPTFLGDFSLPGRGLRDQGMNRIGNLLVPNDNYCLFEEWIVPVLDKMLAEQEADPELVWSPSTVIARLGKQIDNEDSVLYWAYKNDIPIFCPALTDGSIGDMLFFHTFRTSPQQLKIDIVSDIRRINSMSMAADRAGMIILGGGIVKHHIANACLMRNGADYAVYINTGQEFDGSDAGARPDEAVSWGKIRADARSVKVYADATIVFPLVVAATFAAEDDEVKE
ncbi:Deoxyhypusine synthase [Limtongia smithiae]|uniref:Deoxyhypusine synthase n=1 Tax=Limtongia smithiae TaxID=1125753 RepID=UPI0034CE1780